MRYIISTIILFFIGITQSYSQSYTEALRYSQLNFGSTARTQGVAGSFGALGGDYGIVSLNPSGLAEFRLSEFSFSPDFGFSSSDATLNGAGPKKDRDAYFNIDEIGLVFANAPIASNWTTNNFSIGYSKLSNLDQAFSYEGTSPGSLVARYSELTPDGVDPDLLDDFEAGPAYEVGATYLADSVNFIYALDFDDPYSQVVQKEQTVQRSGGYSELSFAWAAQYDRKFNIGASLNIPLVSYEEEKLYQESDVNNEIDFFDALSYSEFLTTSGAGINLKLGASYKLTQSLRIGAAYHTPTILSLSDEYYTIHYYKFTDSNGPSESDSRSPDGSFNYRVRTPQRIIGSLAYLFRTDAIAGFINGDVEYIDYTQNNFNLTSSDNSGPADKEIEDLNNGLIKSDFAKSLSYRIGIELAKSHYRVRGGLALSQSPYSADENKFDSNLSLGLGYRSDNWFFDIAGVQRNKSEGYVPYQLEFDEDEQFVDVESSLLSFVTTFGFKF